MACCKDCGWSEIIGSPIVCHYTGHRTFRDECCEAWKPKEEEKPGIVEVVRCKDCKNFVWNSISQNAGSCGIGIGDGVNKWHSKDWFCANGKREEG